MHQESLMYFIRLSRPFNLPAMLLPFLIGYFYFSNSADLVLWIGILIIVFLHSSLTIENDIQDIKIDKMNKRKSVITDDELSTKSARIIVLLLILLALVAIVIEPSLKLFVLWSSILFLGWVYNNKPLQLSRKPIPSIVVLALFYSFIPLVIGFKFNESEVSIGFLLFAVFLSLQRFSISMLKDYKDISGDTKYNKRTFLSKYGYETVANISVLFGLVSYIAIITILYFKLSPSVTSLLCISLLLLIATVNIRNRLGLLRTKDSKVLGKIFVMSFLGENNFNGVLLLCLIFSQ